jgi:hypothetical protein
MENGFLIRFISDYASFPKGTRAFILRKKLRLALLIINLDHDFGEWQDDP